MELQTEDETKQALFHSHHKNPSHVGFHCDFQVPNLQWNKEPFFAFWNTSVVSFLTWSYLYISLT